MSNRSSLLSVTDIATPSSLRPTSWVSVLAMTAVCCTLLSACGKTDDNAPTPPPVTSNDPVPYDVFVIGQDLAPGVYKAQAAEQVAGVKATCYWERDSDDSGSIESVLASGVVSQQAVVQVQADDARLRSYGCSAWVPADQGNPAQATSFGSDAVLVGRDVVVGTYRADRPGADCYWERTSDALGGRESILASGTSTGEPIQVQLSEGDFLFNSYGCGTWSLLGT